MIGKEKPKVQTLLEALFMEAIGKLSNANGGQLVWAMHIQLDMDAGEALVYDERENLLEKNIIYDWVERAEKGMRLYKQAVHFTRVSLAALRTRKVFDNPMFMRPFKVALVDDNFNEIETLLAMEGSDVLAEGRLMKNLEADLQNFSRKIFAELE